jgi:purine operon repressor
MGDDAMEKLKRNERVGALMNILTRNPNKIFSYSYFCQLFNVRKSSISGDVAILKELLEKLDLGLVETITGSNGGVKFIPKIKKEELIQTLEDLSIQLSNPERIIPGGFIFMLDILYNPEIIKKLGLIIANKFINKHIDYIVTIETKGIPLALMTAEVLNVPLVIIRKNIKITEGSTVNINYVSGSTKMVQTMSLSKKSLKENSKVLIVDDFMRGGGTFKGVYEMMSEFKASVVGTCVLIATKFPEKKLVDNYISLLTMEKIDEEKKEVVLTPNFL